MVRTSPILAEKLSRSGGAWSRAKALPTVVAQISVSRCLLDIVQGKCFGHVPQGKSPGRKICWRDSRLPGNALGPTQESLCVLGCLGSTADLPYDNVLWWERAKAQIVRLGFVQLLPGSNSSWPEERREIIEYLKSQGHKVATKEKREVWCCHVVYWEKIDWNQHSFMSIRSSISIDDWSLSMQPLTLALT